jgi:serine/threonine protein kinase
MAHESVPALKPLPKPSPSALPTLRPPPISPVSVTQPPCQFSCVQPLSRSPTLADGAATVFKAIHTASGREVAVKTYLKRDLQKAFGGERVTRVTVEREALARLSVRIHSGPGAVLPGGGGVGGAAEVRSPPAPALLAATHDEYAVALIMQLAKGRTAAEAVFAGCCAPAETIRGVVDALEQIHAVRVLHLDLTLENVVLGERGERGVTLVDFGSAALEDCVERDRDYSRSSSIEVLAPELLDGARAPSRAADVWGLGVAAFRLLNRGRMPWFGKGDFQVMQEIAVREAGGRLRFDAGVAEEAADFVQRCLHPDPAARLGVLEVDEESGRAVVDYAVIRAHPFLAKASGESVV